MPSPDQQRLDLYLREIAKSDRFGSVDALAVVIKENPSSLRTAINRNTFTAKLLKKLHQHGVLAQKPDALPAHFSFQLTRERRPKKTALFAAGDFHEFGTMERVFGVFDSHARRLTNMQGDFERLVGALYSALGLGDFFVYVSRDQMPVEWRPDGWWKLDTAICNAVRVGANLTYVLANDPAPDQTDESGPKLGLKETLFKTRFEEFKTQIKKHQTGRTNSQIDEQVRIRFASDGPFFLPASKVALFRTNNPKSHRAIISVRHGVESWQSLPLDQEFCNELASWLQRKNLLPA